jgi:hypothetical protein
MEGFGGGVFLKLQSDLDGTDIYYWVCADQLHGLDASHPPVKSNPCAVPVSVCVSYMSTTPAIVSDNPHSSATRANT